MRKHKTEHILKLFDFTKPLTAEQAEYIFSLGKEAVIFMLISLSEKIAQVNKAKKSKAHQPSGSIPVYEKPSVKKKDNKPGGKKGHPGYSRPLAEITATKEYKPLESCQQCGSSLSTVVEYRSRIIEDIMETLPEAVEHKIPRQWCPTCKKLVEPKIEDALPGARFGNPIVALTSWLHYGLGISISQIQSILNHHLFFKTSKSGLVNLWQRLSDVLSPWYDQIGKEIQSDSILHADETGWRLSGETVWLWCFTNSRGTYYQIDRSRGSPALKQFFKEYFNGILITDFWAAYNAVEAAGRQVCLDHLFRELSEVGQRNSSCECQLFVKGLKLLLHDGISLSKRRQDMDCSHFERKRDKIRKRLDKFISHPWQDKDAKRLAKRLKRFNDALLTFLYYDDVPVSNNHAEREIRPCVVMRKNIQGNRSLRGAMTQSILMSVYRTLRLRGYDPLETIVSSLRAYIREGTLPQLPK